MQGSLMVYHCLKEAGFLSNTVVGDIIFFLQWHDELPHVLEQLRGYAPLPWNGAASGSHQWGIRLLHQWRQDRSRNSLDARHSPEHHCFAGVVSIGGNITRIRTYMRWPRGHGQSRSFGRDRNVKVSSVLKNRFGIRRRFHQACEFLFS